MHGVLWYIPRLCGHQRLSRCADPKCSHYEWNMRHLDAQIGCSLSILRIIPRVNIDPQIGWLAGLLKGRLIPLRFSLASSSHYNSYRHSRFTSSNQVRPCSILIDVQSWLQKTKTNCIPKPANPTTSCLQAPPPRPLLSPQSSRAMSRLTTAANHAPAAESVNLALASSCKEPRLVRKEERDETTMMENIHAEEGPGRRIWVTGDSR